MQLEFQDEEDEEPREDPRQKQNSLSPSVDKHGSSSNNYTRSTRQIRHAQVKSMDRTVSSGNETSSG